MAAGEKRSRASDSGCVRPLEGLVPVVDHPDDGARQRGGVVRGHQEPGPLLLDEFGEAADVCRNDRNAGQHRLDDRQAESF